MQQLSPMLTTRPLSARHRVEPNDVLVVKRSLQRLGHYQPVAGELNDTTEDSLFDGIKSFQKQQNLRVDGLIRPDGETASKITGLLELKTPDIGSIVAVSSKDDEDYKKQCDHLYWNVDIPVCRAIEARRGKRAATRCFHSATFRYGSCLGGTPMENLPPLDTYNN